MDSGPDPGLVCVCVCEWCSGDMIDKEVSTVRGAAVRASVASLLQGLSDVEKKAILSGL